MIDTYRYYNIVIEICYNIDVIDTYRYYNIVKICDHRNDRYIQVL